MLRKEKMDFIKRSLLSVCYLLIAEFHFPKGQSIAAEKFNIAFDLIGAAAFLTQYLYWKRNVSIKSLISFLELFKEKYKILKTYHNDLHHKHKNLLTLLPPPNIQ